MKKLRVRFWQNENVVMMKILEQSESLREKGDFFRDPNFDMTICSVDFPSLESQGLLIRGRIKEKDNLINCIQLSSIENATVYIKKCKELIRSFNSSIEEREEKKEEIETWIFE
jgi:hypothetical protein